MFTLGAVGLVAVAGKVIDFAKSVTNRDVNAVVTQAAAWAGGVATTFLFGASDFASGVPVGDLVLSDVNGWSKVVIGVMVGSGASLAYDLKRALDSTDSAKTASLLPGNKD